MSLILAAMSDEDGGSQVPTESAYNTARNIIRARQLRKELLGPDLFADPAWDILLALYVAKVETRQVSISSLCIASAVPATTALRWIASLDEKGLLVGRKDEADARRRFVELSPDATARVQACLEAISAIG